MGEGRRSVLVTGSTGTIGRQLCQALYHDDRVKHVIALARDPEPYYFRDYDRNRFTFKQTDILRSREIQNFFLSEAFREARPDTVVHLAFANRPSVAAEPGAHSLNVEGTKALLDRSCEAGIRSFIFQSSDAVYRIRPWNPVLLDEEADLNFAPDASQWVRDRVDADMICRLRLNDPRCRMLILRPASIIGRNIHSSWSAYLENHWVIPKVLGYDPMIAPTHATDVIRALSMAVHRDDVSGVFNLAGLDAAPLSTWIRLVGAVALPLPRGALRLVNRVQRALRLTEYDYAAVPEALRYGCLLDTRKAREVLGWAPQYHIKFG